MLRIYIATHCRNCTRALALVERLREQRPTLPCALIDIDEPGVVIPKQVIGTPIYMWNDRILFMGNPSETELLERVDELSHHQSCRAAQQAGVSARS